MKSTVYLINKDTKEVEVRKDLDDTAMSLLEEEMNQTGKTENTLVVCINENDFGTSASISFKDYYPTIIILEEK